MVMPRLHPTRRTIMAGEIFNPRSIENLQLWYDADDQATVLDNSGNPVTDGGDVYTWVSKGIQALEIEPISSGEEPTYHLATRNGRNVVRFDSSSTQNLVIDKGSNVIEDFPCTMFTVFASTDVANAQAVFGIADDTSDTDFWYHWLRGNEASDPMYLNFRNTVSGQLILSLTTQYISGQTHLITSRLTGVDLKEAWADGGNKKADTGTYAWPSDMHSVSCGVKYDLVPSQYFTGDICECLVYSRALSTNERTEVNEYLHLKWGFNIAP